MVESQAPRNIAMYIYPLYCQYFELRNLLLKYFHIFDVYLVLLFIGKNIRKIKNTVQILLITW